MRCGAVRYEWIEGECTMGRDYLCEKVEKEKKEEEKEEKKEGIGGGDVYFIRLLFSKC